MRLRGMGVVLGCLWLWTAGCDSDDEHPCGPAENGLSCAADELCVTKAIQLISYECAPNPCKGAAVDCSCAASVCGSFSCALADEDSVTCNCPSC